MSDTTTQGRLEVLLKKEFDPSFLSVEDQSDGCGAKFFVGTSCNLSVRNHFVNDVFLRAVVIVSTKFEGVGLLQRHRSVNKCIENEMKDIHAIQMKTWTPKQYEKKKHTLSA